jgi:hypothetical protein
MGHETVKLSLPWSDDDEAVDIDAAIAPLVRAIWTRGIPTISSCENDPPGYVVVAFASWSGVTAFLDIVGRAYRVDIEMASEIPDRPPRDARWLVCRRSCGVRFPRRQLTHVMAALWAARERSPAETHDRRPPK